MLISVRDWQKNAHLRERRTYNVKDEMKNMKYETLQIYTVQYKRDEYNISLQTCVTPTC